MAAAITIRPWRRQSGNSKKIIIIAGPNGAGKTTFATAFLPQEAACPDSINADLIARGLSPFAPKSAAIAAGRIMLQQIADKVQAGRSFAFETTLSGLSYARHIPLWRKAGYHVKLIFLSLPTAELALARVRARVAQGGHGVPEAIVRRRFDAGLRNFQTVYRTMVNSWMLYDSSGPTPRLLDTGQPMKRKIQSTDPDILGYRPCGGPPKRRGSSLRPPARRSTSCAMAASSTSTPTPDVHRNSQRSNNLRDARDDPADRATANATACRPADAGRQAIIGSSVASIRSANTQPASASCS